MPAARSQRCQMSLCWPTPHGVQRDGTGQERRASVGGTAPDLQPPAQRLCPGDQDHPAAARPAWRGTEPAQVFSPLTRMLLHCPLKERYVSVDEGSTLQLLGCTRHGMVTRTALVRAGGACWLPFHGIGSYTKTSRAYPTVSACARFSRHWLPLSLVYAHHSSHCAEPGGRQASPVLQDTSAGLGPADLLWHVTADLPGTARTQPSTHVPPGKPRRPI